ncbi:winged helix-turn-helix domain-containing protein [Vibrio hepatarius]|uniref:winged helix-turn-helix domain-containing protein n=1 Tax=Vibrio hepatarius TaxID=171383 RepID=UPI003736E64A
MDLLDEAKRTGNAIAFANLIYNPASKTLSDGNKDIPLEPRNIALLEVLLSNINQPTSIEEFITQVWESQYVSKNVVTNRISLLRNILRENIPDIDSNKLIVTYPKKGYYIPQSHVQLVEPFNKASRVSCENIAKNTPKPTSSKKTLSLSLLVVASLTILVTLVNTFFDVKVKSKGQALYVPQVRLLLDQISSSKQTTRRDALKLKVLLLHSYSHSPYIHLANMRSPSYYLMSLSEHDYFPGSDALNDSDYKLTFNLIKDDSDTDKLEVILNHSASARVAWRNIYTLNGQQLVETINRLNSDLTEYFKLPKPIVSIEQNLKTDLSTLSEIQFEQLVNQDMSDAEISFYTRELLFSTQSEEVLTQWINKVKQTTPPSPELHMLLALLTYRAGDIEKSLQMLQREYVAEIPSNALILMLQANISHKTHNIEQYLSNYLKATAALTITLPATQVLEHYTSENKQFACLGLWKDALANIGSIHMPNSILWQGVERFCAPTNQD